MPHDITVCKRTHYVRVESWYVWVEASCPAVVHPGRQHHRHAKVPRHLHMYIQWCHRAWHTHTHNDWSVCLLHCQKGPSLPFQWEYIEISAYSYRCYECHVYCMQLCFAHSERKRRLLKFCNSHTYIKAGMSAITLIVFWIDWLY